VSQDDDEADMRIDPIFNALRASKSQAAEMANDTYEGANNDKS